MTTKRSSVLQHSVKSHQGRRRGCTVAQPSTRTSMLEWFRDDLGKDVHKRILKNSRCQSEEPDWEPQRYYQTMCWWFRCRMKIHAAAACQQFLEDEDNIANDWCSHSSELNPIRYCKRKNGCIHVTLQTAILSFMSRQPSNELFVLRLFAFLQ